MGRIDKVMDFLARYGEYLLETRSSCRVGDQKDQSIQLQLQHALRPKLSPTCGGLQSTDGSTKRLLQANKFTEMASGGLSSAVAADLSG